MHIVGVVSLADVLQAGDMPQPEATPIAPFVRRGVTYVPETKSVGDLLRELRYTRPACEYKVNSKPKDDPHDARRRLLAERVLAKC